MGRSKSNIMNTSEWLAANQQYHELQGLGGFTILGGSSTKKMLSPEESDRALEAIVTVCPEYFPVWFHRGEAMLRDGKSAEGKKFMDRGFDYMASILEDEEAFSDMLQGTVENLEKLLRYDVAAGLLEKAVRLFPDTVSFYDDLAFYLLQPPMEDKARALRMQEKTLEMDPDNDIFINNLGWVYLQMGDFKKAELYFQKAMEFNIDNQGAFENMDIAEYMHKHRLSYFEYLVRPADMKELNQLVAEGDPEEAEERCRDYNADRLRAFKTHHLRNKTLPPHEILANHDRVKIFMAAAGGAVTEYLFLYEATDLFQRHSRQIFRSLVIEYDILDGGFLEDICGSVTVFYDFLREMTRITTDQLKRFTDHLKPLIAEFSNKANEYSRLCEDGVRDEEEREEAIERIFGVL